MRIQEQVKDTRKFHLTFTFQKIEGEDGPFWSAHCLDIDLVSCGKDLHHAKCMIEEAVGDMIPEYLNEGTDLLTLAVPIEERKAALKIASVVELTWTDAVNRQDSLQYAATQIEMEFCRVRRLVDDVSDVIDLWETGRTLRDCA